MTPPSDEPTRPTLRISPSPHRLERRSGTDQQRTGKFVIDAARLMSDSHCQEVIICDLRELSDLTDYLLIGSGTSDRQMSSVGDDLDQLAPQFDLSCYGRESDSRSTWIVLDFIDVMVHLFEPASRAHYDLEMLWGDAPRMPWRRGDSSSEGAPGPQRSRG